MVVINSTLLATDSDPIQLEESRLTRLNIPQLELRLARIDSRLMELAKPSMQTGVGPVGYRSKPFSDSSSHAWIKIDLEQAQPIDQIVLVPAIWRDTQTGFRADGFPIEFKILIGTEDDSDGELIASFTTENQLLPRVAPVIIRCHQKVASWVRIEVTKLSNRAWDNQPILQLSEILIFNKTENVALRQVVNVSSEDEDVSGARSRKNLVDGFVPYLMDAWHGEQSIAFVSKFGIGSKTELMIDLESEYAIDRIHLHATDSSDTVPRAVPADFGVPVHFIIEGAMSRDFSDAIKLVEYRKETVYESGPIIMWRFPVINCQFVRLTVLEPYTFERQGVRGSQIGFAEIELFSKGRNVALGKKASATFAADSAVRFVTAVTDGNNLYGQILPIKTWLGQLAERHDLETQRPIVAAELNLRYQRQRTNLARLSWLAAFLAAAAVITIFVGKNLQQRAVARTREQIAADLHDELGANFHAIGLLTDLAQAASDSPDRLKPLMQRMRELTERTGKAANYCANMLDSKGLFGDLEQDMRRSSNRLMADLEHDISIDGREFLSRLSLKNRIGLLLFYKESLTNIIRHSGATHVITELKADADIVCLNVEDNGNGMSTNSQDSGDPPSLKRRARLLGGKLMTCRPESGGTRIELRLTTSPPSVFRFLSRKKV